MTFSVSNLQSAKTIVHGSAATVTVEDGEVAVIRNVGKRQTLGPGRYKLEAPQQVWAWSFECLISPIVAAAFALAVKHWSRSESVAHGPSSWCCRGLQVYEKHMYIGVRTTPPEEIVTYDSQRIPIRVKFTVTYEIRDPARAAQFRSKYGKPSVGSQCWLPVLLMPKGGCCPVPVAVVW